VYYAFQVEPFSLETQIDGFIYAGYSLNFADLIHRYGFPYFSVRFALILPARAATYLLGPVGGYFVLRYCLGVLAAGSVYLLARRHGSKSAGWLGALVLLSSPIFLRALMTFYADTVGLPMLVVVLSCLLMPSKRRGLWYLGAGLACGMAINANLYLAGLIAVLLVANLALGVLRQDERVLVQLVRHALVAAGVLVITGLGALYYRQRFGLTNVLYPSWHFFITEAQLASRNARAPSYAWLNFSLYLYIPPLILLTCTTFLIVRYLDDKHEGKVQPWHELLRSPLLHATVFLGTAEGFYVFVEFILRGYQLEYFFYASYLMAFAIVALTLLAAEIGRQGWIPSRILLGLPFAVVFIPIARHRVFPNLTLWAMLTVPIMASMLIALVLAAHRRAWLGNIVLAALVGCVAILGIAAPRNLPLSPGQTIRGDPHYETAIGTDDRTGLQIFELASQLIKLLPSWKDDPGTTVFWYRSGEYVVNLIQGTYVWLPATIQYGGPGLPTLSSQEVSELKGRTPRRLVILGELENDIVTGHRELIDAGVRPEAFSDRVLRAGKMKVFVELMRFTPSSCDKQWRSLAFAWANLRVSCS
jgi:4-amino-4-deoxy-L-arabinose transferase-like glycosyltransferase